MKQVVGIIILFLFLVTTAAAQIGVQPVTIDNGSAALLRWDGPVPSRGEAHFADQVFPLRIGDDQSVALLAADLDLPPGSYPVVVTLEFSDGSRQTHRLELQVRYRERPVQRLTLPAEQVTPRAPEVLERIQRDRKVLTEIFSHSSEPVLWRYFLRPVDDPSGSPFGVRRILNDEPRAPHSGVDFRSPRGTPIRAAAHGRVVLAEDLFFTGNTVVLDHGGGLYSLYAHLDDFSCTPGELLEAGAILGRVGSTGRSTGPHLHWGVRLQNQRIDPLVLLELLPRESS
jgi:murein DD-endopeptidase MepM/ murein hydrolase activator NlpD